MAAKPRPRSNSLSAAGAPPRPTTLRVRRAPGQNAWELVHPSCARTRAEDIDEVRNMIDAGETEIAIDELRWLLNGCGDFVDAHRLLGELALLESDFALARGHFGYGYEIGMSAIQAQPGAGPFPYSRPANQSFLEAAKGLAFCLQQLEKPALAREVLETMLRLDPTDPLGAGKMLASLPSR